MILIDTNILARAIERPHLHHQVALDALALLSERDHEVLVITPQVLVEFYAISTRATNNLALTAEQALAEIEGFKQRFPLLPESRELFPKWEWLVAKYKPRNRLVFDMRHVALMLVHKVSSILTFNDKDFVACSEINVLNPFDLLNLPRR